MVGRSPKGRKRDSNVLAKSIVDKATGHAATEVEERPDPDKDPKAVKAGRLGGLKGGKSRAEKLTAEQRKKIARIAANARWRKSTKQ